MNYCCKGLAVLGALPPSERLENDRAVASMHATEEAQAAANDARASSGAFFASPLGFLVAGAGAAGVAYLLSSRRRR